MRKCKCGSSKARHLPVARRYMCDDCARSEGLLVKCTGEAHSNAYIDNCGLCAPRWGWCEPRLWKVTQGTSVAKVRGATYADAVERAKAIGFPDPDSVVLQS